MLAHLKKAQYEIGNYSYRQDFSETSMPSLLDMVKVLSFALQEGKVSLKMAVIIINKWYHYILSKVVLLSCLALQ